MTPTIKSNFPLASLANDGFSKEGEASATCFCGKVQLAFPTEAPGLVKLTASMFATNFAVLDTHLKHLRGKDNLTEFGQAVTPASGNKMTNYFCQTCGSLMYRVSSGFPGMSILRVGSVDDFSLMETKLKPQFEQVIETRMSWLKGAEGVPQYEGHHLK
ncbi:hypothetical protein P7C70_g3914, partial [Phenoliferia sp. Uapishka_3]